MAWLDNIVWSPEEYAKSAVVAAEAATELMERLSWMTLKPRLILDVGCGLGELSTRLRAQYPEAMVLGIDHSEAMLQHALNLNPQNRFIGSDAKKLPLANASVDMIAANFLLPWQTMLKPLFKEWRRVLRPNGLLIFTALGPDTLKEFHNEVKDEEMPQCVDMHDLGDFLLKEGFADPVLDVNYYTLSYRNKENLFKELLLSGMMSAEGIAHLTQGSNHAEVTYEVVCGHTWIPAQEKKALSSEIKVPISQLQRSSR